MNGGYHNRQGQRYTFDRAPTRFQAVLKLFSVDREASRDLSKLSDNQEQFATISGGGESSIVTFDQVPA